MRKNIGIDFGTTNTVVSFRDSSGKIRRAGGTSIRSALFFISEDEYIIGHEAVSRGMFNSDALVTDFKPNIKGDTYYVIAENGDEFELTPRAAAVCFLNKVLTEYIEKRLAKWYDTPELDDDDRTVITVPVKFNTEEKKAIKTAAEKAQFINVYLAFEPTAAAIASSENTDDNIIAVFDFGGGTFDISVIERHDEGRFSYIDSDGDKELGGNRINGAIAANIIFPKLIKQGCHFDFKKRDFIEPFDSSDYEEDDRKNYFYIKTAAENIKTALSDMGYTEKPFVYPMYIMNDGERAKYEIEVTYGEFEDCICPIINKTISITRRLIESVKKNGADVTRIIMAGGSSQIPLVRDMLENEFQNDGIEISAKRSEIFNLISTGALMICEKENAITIEEKTATQFGIAEKTAIGTSRFHSIISENSVIPVKGRQSFRIDSGIISSGEMKIECYDRDIKSYPDAVNAGDEGISYINTYIVPIERELNPETAEIIFCIDDEGQLSLEANILDKIGNTVKNLNIDVGIDSVME